MTPVLLSANKASGMDKQTNVAWEGGGCKELCMKASQGTALGMGMAEL